VVNHSGGTADQAKHLLRGRRFWVMFFLGCLVIVAFDHLKTVVGTLVNTATVYRRLVTSGFKPLYPRKTSIIQISNADEPMEVTLVNVCQQRLFLGRLLNALLDRRPSVVVIDKIFSPGSCPNQTEGTQALQSAVQQLLSKGATVIIGIDADAKDRLLPTVDFPAGQNGNQVTRASILFEEDVRKAVFTWDHFHDPAGAPTKVKTLSFAAALASIPHLLEVNSRLQRFYREDAAPYVAFLPPNAFAPFTFSAIKVLCGPQADSKTDWRKCATPDNQAIAELSNRVVVIGEDTLGVDHHETVVGSVPGLWLHANYIEAILDDDLFQPVADWITWMFGFVIFFLVELILSIGPLSSRNMLAIATVVAAYVVCFLVVRLTGLYLNPGLGLVALLFKGLETAARSWFMPKETSVTT